LDVSNKFHALQFHFVSIDLPHIVVHMNWIQNIFPGHQVESGVLIQGDSFVDYKIAPVTAIQKEKRVLQWMV
jgi:hypothetical protein